MARDCQLGAHVAGQNVFKPWAKTSLKALKAVRQGIHCEPHLKAACWAAAGKLPGLSAAVSRLLWHVTASWAPMWRGRMCCRMRSMMRCRSCGGHSQATASRMLPSCRWPQETIRRKGCCVQLVWNEEGGKDVPTGSCCVKGFGCAEVPLGQGTLPSHRLQDAAILQEATRRLSVSPSCNILCFQTVQGIEAEDGTHRVPVLGVRYLQMTFPGHCLQDAAILQQIACCKSWTRYDMVKGEGIRMYSHCPKSPLRSQ